MHSSVRFAGLLRSSPPCSYTTLMLCSGTLLHMPLKSNKKYLFIARPLPASMSLHVLLEIRHVLLVVASGTFSLASQVQLAAAVCRDMILDLAYISVWNNMPIAHVGDNQRHITGRVAR